MGLMNLGDATILRDFSYPPTSRVYFSMALMRALASQASFRRTLSGTIGGRGRRAKSAIGKRIHLGNLGTLNPRRHSLNSPP